MANDLLKKLEEKINEAIETIELSRMEVTDLKEQNEELENRYADWETRLSTLIEKFEQLEDSEDAEVEEEVNAAMQDTEEEPEEEVEAAEALDPEDAEDEEVEAADALDSEDDEVEDSDDEEELGSTFGTNADSFTEAPESAQHYA
jgi:cell division protein ZapB